MKTIELYIGSNNVTHELELDKIEKILANGHDGFTIQEAKGYWLGKPERTAVVTIAGDLDEILDTIDILKNELHQDAIAYRQVPSMVFA
jgi:hypothetical protein